MRVSGIAVMLFIMLLALGSLAPAAGATYIEGHSIPDDGTVHILAAEERSGQTGIPYTGLSGLSQAIPSLFAKEISPEMKPFERAAPMTNATGSTHGEDIVNGSTIGHIASPSVAGYWNFVDPGGIQTNMPVLKGLFA